MILSRAASLFLRAAQFISSAIVLGLVAYFLHAFDNPFGRLVYGIIISTLSLIASLILLIPTTSSITSYATDLFFSAGFFALFGLLVSWIRGTGCGSIWAWGNISSGNYCGLWQAAQAFSFLAAIFWFASFVLGLIVVHRLSKRVAHTDGVRSNRRWGRSRV